jgi:PAS domain S-box-containing protein
MHTNLSIPFPGYTLVEQLGETYHSAVFRARPNGQTDTVILKVVGANNPTPEQIARFKHENILIQNLDIDGIIRPIDFLEKDGLTALVLEDFGGLPLKELMSKSIDLERTLKLAIRLAQILGALHLANITHRDIKPSNILLNPESDILKITDFGISEIVPVSDQIAPSNTPKGTLAYISPEQTGRMNCGVDYRTDLYSLGVTFYEMLTGSIPFREKNPMDLIHAHIARQPLPPSELNPDVPAPVSAIVMKLMAKSAEERYQSGFGLAADLSECLRQLESTGRVEPFALGARDVSLRFSLPRQLVGRNAELDLLHATFGRVRRGATEIVMVAGAPGSGKSVLVNEIHQPVVAEGGYFLCGKFEQFQKAVPYSAIIQAFQSLARQMLAESDVRLRLWKQQLLSALGPNGRIITDVIPEIEQIIGKQPPVPELGPEETQNRFNLFFKLFVRTLADENHPLVLFLDDLQWADHASMHLVQTILTDRNLHFLLFVGAYRDTELSQNHPVHLAMAKIADAAVPSQSIHLQTLDPQTINQWIAPFLSCDPAVSRPLAEAIHEKTKGSPFYVHQFLKRLYDKEYLYPNSENGCWRWHLPEISGMQATDNVVAFLAEKLHDLPAGTLQTVQLCAAVGEGFDLEAIAAISQRTMGETLAEIDVLIQEGLVLRTENHYRFYHDRIQEAAYSLVSASQREQLHYRIGQYSLQTASEKGPERIFFICDQLNQAVGCITSGDESIRLAGLNLKAGIKAKESTAYAAAASYLASGIALLTAEAWHTHYALTFELFIEQMACQYQNRNVEEAERLFGIIIAKAATKLDKARAYSIMIELYTSTRPAREAVELGLEALKIFDLHLKPDPGRAKVLIELIKARIRLKKIGIENVAGLPNMQDEHLRAMHALLDTIGLPAYYTQKNLCAIINLLNVNATLKHGLMPQASGVFTFFGSLVQTVWGDYESAGRIGRMALRLDERLDNAWLKGHCVHTYALMIGHWKNHLKTGLEQIMEACELSRNSGNFVYAGYGILVAAEYRLALGCRLDQVLDDLLRHQDFFAHLKDLILTPYYRKVVRFIQAMQGPDAKSNDLVEKDFDDSALIQKFRHEKNHFGLFLMIKFKIATDVLFGRTEEAWGVGQSFLARSGKLFSGTFLEAYQLIFNLLALTSHLRKGPRNGLRQHGKTIRRHLGLLRKWARLCPENFQHLHDLFAAEIAGLNGQFQTAMELYHAAIDGAHAHQFVMIEAMAYERLGDFYLTGRYKGEAGHAIQQAHRIYLALGAQAKADNLRERYPELFKFKGLPGGKEADSRSTLSENASRHLDLATVMQASHIISSEIMLDRLLAMTMHTAITNAGAQTGYLMLWSGEQWIIQASEDMQTGEKQVLQEMPLEACRGLSHGIVNYVQHSGEPLILHNAARQGDFTTDPHIVANRCKSILCLPILNKGMTTGILYMENNLTAEAFTAERIEILQFISAQAAISIQNARLYEKISAEIAVRKDTAMALRASEEKFRTILEEMPDIFCETDLQGTITFVNASAGKISGYAPSELIGFKIQNLLTGTGQQSIERYYHEIHVTGRPGKLFSDMLKAKNGERISLEILASPMRDNNGRIIGFRNVGRDDSERRRLEKDLLESYQNVKYARTATLLGLAKLSEYRDEATGAHLERIREYVRIIARQLARTPKYKGYITEAYIEDIYNSAILHDIGKVGVPDAILLKPGKLTSEEFETIKTHTLLGGDALREVESQIQGQTFLTLSKEIAYHHHEKWDGSGYPKGLKGEQIPLSAQIVALADVYDALISKRCYKEAFSHEKAVEIITKDRGTHFAPDVVDAFLVQEDAFRRIGETLTDSPPMAAAS